MFDDGPTIRIHGEDERRVLAAAAPSSRGGPGAALVLFHGFAVVADQFAANTGLLAEAADRGVTPVVPFGLRSPATWEQGEGPSIGLRAS